MKKLISWGAIAATVAALLGASTAAAASAQFKLMAQAKIFDPDHTGQVTQAQWVGGAGEGGDQGLVFSLDTTVPYPPGASADATIMRVEGHMLNSLAFDHKLGTACTGGAPR